MLYFPAAARATQVSEYMKWEYSYLKRCPQPTAHHLGTITGRVMVECLVYGHLDRNWRKGHSSNLTLKSRFLFFFLNQYRGYNQSKRHVSPLWTFNSLTQSCHKKPSSPPSSWCQALILMSTSQVHTFPRGNTWDFALSRIKVFWQQYQKKSMHFEILFNQLFMAAGMHVICLNSDQPMRH